MSDLIKAEDVSKIFVTSKFFIGKKQIIKAVENFYLHIQEEKPEIISIVGESGSGKTTIARLLLGLIKPTYGTIYFRGRDIWKLSRTEQEEYRRNIQAIFQDPYAAFNPLHPVEHSIKISIKKFKLASGEYEIEKKIEEGLQEVGLKYNEITGKYPHQLSGGERQRVMIARAFVLKPRLIIADEPVSMLDASIRANILNIMKDLKERWNISFIYITHDLSTTYYISDYIVVMYRGQIVERGLTDNVLMNPLHPYTRLLLDAIPLPDPERRWETRGSISSTETEKEERGKGCKFYLRCPKRMERCRIETPILKEVNGREVKCFLYC